ncbi:MAG: sterol desaturase family protein [Saprospiraceae bacterium]|nr:sterol desaturase family protein [Saprospiraceae bacterium]
MFVGIIFFRYLFVSYIFYFVFYVLSFDTYKGRKISSKMRKPKQSQKEIWRSFWSSGIFAVGGFIFYLLFEKGYTAVYTDVSEMGIAYLVVSFFLIMFLHETYYYWLHRWIHKPGIYEKVHLTHHDSIITSVWTSFSFHPIESFLQVVFIPVIIIFVPAHIVVVMALLFIMTVSATINHLDIEIYPRNFHKNFIGKWLIGATHHSLHHTEFITNYGLYFTFWDKWMNTESKNFEPVFEKLTAKVDE